MSGVSKWETHVIRSIVTGKDLLCEWGLAAQMLTEEGSNLANDCFGMYGQTSMGSDGGESLRTFLKQECLNGKFGPAVQAEAKRALEKKDDEQPQGNHVCVGCLTIGNHSHRCPTCQSIQIVCHFCSQDCFRQNWNTHKKVHLMMRFK